MPVAGSIIIADDSETAATQFISAPTAAYDLRPNSTAIALAVPDLNPATPPEYTEDWDAEPAHIFKIVMNESEHRIEVFTNNTDGATSKYYGFDMDDSEASGGSAGGPTGVDFVFGYIPMFGGALLACYNSSLADFTFMDLSAGSGNFTCGNVTGFDENFNGNFTIYWNNSGAAFEFVSSQAGPWADKKAQAGDLVSILYTNFKNSSVQAGGLGNLTLRNATLQVDGNFTVDGVLDARGSSVAFNKTNTEFLFNFGALAALDNASISSGIADQSYQIIVYSTGFVLNNSFVDNASSPDNSIGLLLAGSGAIVGNATFGSSVNVAVVGSGNLISASYFPNFLVVAQPSAYNNTIRGNNASTIATQQDAHDNLFENNTIRTLLAFYPQGVSTGGVNNTFLNNILSSSALFDAAYPSSPNTTASNYMIYNNSFGEVRWYSSNFTIPAATNLSIGSGVYVQDNLIGLADDANLANLNVSAQLTFYGLPHASTPWLLKNGERCDDNASLCNISYDAGTGTLYATVGGFSNYTTVSAPAPAAREHRRATLLSVSLSGNMAAGSTITVTVADGNDRSLVAEADIRALYWFNGILNAITLGPTNQSGQVEFIPPVSGEYRIEAEKSGYEAAEILFMVAEPPPSVQLEEEQPQEEVAPPEPPAGQPPADEGQGGGPPGIQPAAPGCSIDAGCAPGFVCLDGSCVVMPFSSRQPSGPAEQPAAGQQPSAQTAPAIPLWAWLLPPLLAAAWWLMARKRA